MFTNFEGHGPSSGTLVSGKFFGVGNPFRQPPKEVCHAVNDYICDVLMVVARGIGYVGGGYRVGSLEKEILRDVLEWWRDGWDPLLDVAFLLLQSKKKYSVRKRSQVIMKDPSQPCRPSEPLHKSTISVPALVND